MIKVDVLLETLNAEIICDCQKQNIIKKIMLFLRIENKGKGNIFKPSGLQKILMLTLLLEEN